MVNSDHFMDQYWFNAPLIRTAENQGQGRRGKTYVYCFRVSPPIPMLKSGHAIEAFQALFNHAESSRHGKRV